MRVHDVFLYSAITGYPVSVLLPQDCTQAAKFQLKEDCTRHIIFTAETHNFPTGKSELIFMKEVMNFNLDIMFKCLMVDNVTNPFVIQYNSA